MQRGDTLGDGDGHHRDDRVGGDGFDGHSEHDDFLSGLDQGEDVGTANCRATGFEHQEVTPVKVYFMDRVVSIVFAYVICVILGEPEQITGAALTAHVRVQFIGTLSHQVQKQPEVSPLSQHPEIVPLIVPQDFMGLVNEQMDADIRRVARIGDKFVRVFEDGPALRPAPSCGGGSQRVKNGPVLTLSC